jgi:hypothetical protein
MQPKTRVIRHKDIVGMKFGRLSVLRRAEPDANIKHRGARWVCQCECGTETVVRTDVLGCGTTVSCGCFNKENASRASTTHGMCETAEYRAYWNMKRRCYDTSTRHYKNYGGRGITVCQEWLDSVDLFLSDMGKKPDPSYEIDRKDNNLGYSKDNCRWTTKAINNSNRRVTRDKNANS